MGSAATTMKKHDKSKASATPVAGQGEQAQEATSPSDPVNGMPNYGSQAKLDIYGSGSTRRSLNDSMRRSSSIREKRVSIQESPSNGLLAAVATLHEVTGEDESLVFSTYSSQKLDSPDVSKSNTYSEDLGDHEEEKEDNEAEEKVSKRRPFKLSHMGTAVSVKLEEMPQRDRASSLTMSGKILAKRSASSVFQACDTSVDDFAKKYLVSLPRGGHWCKLGDVVLQFGCPPETIKDSMQLGLAVPQYFVVLGKLFSRTKGLNFAELEFPAYFNFFIRKQRTVVITTEAIEQRVRALFQETLLGPKEAKVKPEDDFLPGTTPDCFPNFRAEGEWLDAARKTLKIDDLLEFKQFSEANMDNSGYFRTLRASLDNNKVSIEFDRADKVFRVHAPDVVETPGFFSLFGEEIVRSIEDDSRTEEERTHVDVPSLIGLPLLGVTMLGTSHGFDPRGETTGFVVWGNRRGTMVDPPPYAIECLMRLGISTRAIDSIVLTHCHSDHDAGTFRRLLFDQHITIYTTTTIFNSFIRKYSAITGLSQEFLRSLLVFRNVCIDEEVYIHGVKWKFFYSLHTIPCIGFAVTLDGKTIAYSADTHNDPHLFERMYEDKVIGQGRLQSLQSFPWDADLILHEAGVPPIHTPMKRLVELPDSVKANLYVVHVANKDVPANNGLRTLSVGETVALDVEPSPMENAIEILDVLSSIDIFHEACQKFRDSVSILQYFNFEKYEAGERIVRTGDPGDKCFVLIRGAARVSWTVNGVSDSKLFNVGDYFGETSLVTGAPRNANVDAVTAVWAATLSLTHFNALVRGTSIREDLISLSETRKTNSWQLVSNHSILGKLSSTAKTQLEVIMVERHFVAGEVAWETGDHADFVMLVQSGLFHLKCDAMALRRDLALSVMVDPNSGTLRIMGCKVYRSPSSAARDPAIPLVGDKQINGTTTGISSSEMLDDTAADLEQSVESAEAYSPGSSVKKQSLSVKLGAQWRN
ncbi:cAMP-dependent protein kinase regulatory subunit [Hondaea fermentalgiana]|uniref:cAMP-dependent protein kinase regulatory subunit n=1 Tax=Hondaea fermentalgiana TaxID=2315210 RepID=A0A2R5GIA3_9STRA|nr:cAMP-dependent protein kinase regulatory subunit [Hondaea fermentalgiana]|eukprot:GBG29458.1 cAMP-dependent protein kinase regulatory subunit [Hondaea fermentalgiana]